MKDGLDPGPRSDQLPGRLTQRLECYPHTVEVTGSNPVPPIQVAQKKPLAAGAARGRNSNLSRIYIPTCLPQLELTLTALPTELNVLLALLPRVVIVPIQTTMSKTRNTASSTPAAPPSLSRNLTT